MRRTIITLAFLLLAACGDDSSGGILTPTTATPTTTATTTAVATPSTGGVVSGLDLVSGLRANASATSTTSAAPQPTSGTTEGPGPFDPGPTYDEYRDLTDDSGQIELSVPVAWSDVETEGWIRDNERIGPAVVAAPDLIAWRGEWGTPGVFIGASDSLGETTESMLDAERWDSSCTYQGRDDYDDNVYTGRYDLYADCGDEGSIFIVIAAEPPEGGFLIYLQIVVVSEADFDAADEIIRTFQVYGVDV